MAVELRGLALAENTITFKTIAGPSPTSAARFAHVWGCHISTLTDLLRHVGRFYFTPDLVAEFARLYPHEPELPKLQSALAKNPKKYRRRIRKFLNRTHDWAEYRRPFNIESTGSIAFQEQVLLTLVRLLATKTEFTEWAASLPPCRVQRLLPLLSVTCAESGDWLHDIMQPIAPLWHIPTEADLELAGKPFQEFVPELYYDQQEYLHLEMTSEFMWMSRFPVDRCRFSAAAAAIQFLSSVPPDSRSQVRKIAIDEDGFSVHGQSQIYGLIPFFRENPRLRVERSISLSRAFFVHGLRSSIPDKFDIWEDIDDAIKKARWVKRHLQPGALSLVFEVWPQRDQADLDSMEVPDGAPVERLKVGQVVFDALEEWSAGPVAAPLCSMPECSGPSCIGRAPTCWTVLEASKQKCTLTKTPSCWRLRVDVAQPLPDAPPQNGLARHHAHLLDRVLEAV